MFSTSPSLSLLLSEKCPLTENYKFPSKFRIREDNIFARGKQTRMMPRPKKEHKFHAKCTTKWDDDSIPRNTEKRPEIHPSGTDTSNCFVLQRWLTCVLWSLSVCVLCVVKNMCDCTCVGLFWAITPPSKLLLAHTANTLRRRNNIVRVLYYYTLFKYIENREWG